MEMKKPTRFSRSAASRRPLTRPREPAKRKMLERETGFEPATSTLARSHSTTELFPPERSKYHTAGRCSSREEPAAALARRLVAVKNVRRAAPAPPLRA